LSILHPKEENETIKIFHTKIQVKKTKMVSLFDFGSHAKLITYDLVSKLGLEFHDHVHQYPLGWVNKDVGLKVTK